MGTLTLEQLVRSVQELPALPDVAMKVLRLTDDPNVSGRDIAQIISTDVGLTARVLRIANSAYYGLPRSISTVSEAIVILGMQALRNLALAASAYDVLKRECDGYGMKQGALWKHSLTTAVAAQVIAGKTRAVRSEEAFVGGLLHDVGKVVLNVYVAPQFQAILALAELDEMPFHVAEREVLGFDHAEVGAKVVEKWNLPPALCTAIGGHHALDRGQEAMPLTAVIHVADALSYSARQGPVSLEPRGAIEPEGLEILQLSNDDLGGVVEEIVVQSHKSSAALVLDRAA